VLTYEDKLSEDDIATGPVYKTTSREIEFFAVFGASAFGVLVDVADASKCTFISIELRDYSDACGYLALHNVLSSLRHFRKYALDARSISDHGQHGLALPDVGPVRHDPSINIGHHVKYRYFEAQDDECESFVSDDIADVFTDEELIDARVIFCPTKAPGAPATVAYRCLVQGYFQERIA
jgi:hypothetical protein